MSIPRRLCEDSSDTPLPGETRSIARLDTRMSHFDLLWLVYLVFFFAEPLQRHEPLPWLVLAAVYPCFLGLFLALLYSRSRAFRPPLLAALAALGVGVITASVAITVIEGLVLHLSPWNWGIFAFFCVPAGVGNLFSAMRKRANHRLSLAHEQIEHLAKVAERERIARDLHDVLGHTLSLIVLKSELAGRVLEAELARARCPEPAWLEAYWKRNDNRLARASSPALSAFQRTYRS